MKKSGQARGQAVINRLCRSLGVSDVNKLRSGRSDELIQWFTRQVLVATAMAERGGRPTRELPLAKRVGVEGARRYAGAEGVERVGLSLYRIGSAPAQRRR